MFGKICDMQISGKKNYLITGYPGIGKTTMIEKISRTFMKHRPVGFFTREIRQGEIRTGFELQSLDGKRMLLSSINIDSPHKVGKYKVDVMAFEQYLESLRFSGNPGNLVIIDEIGKMECMSEKFVTLINTLLESDNTVLLASVALRGVGLISQIKKRNDVTIYEITLKNRDLILQKIMQDIGKTLSIAKH